MTIRIVVLGATNTGKSTLCNVICNQQNAFQTRSSKQATQLSSKHTINKSVAFNFNEQQFEIIDSVGFIQTKLPDTIKQIKQLETDLQGCTYDAISVYLLVIPYERLNGSSHVAPVKFVLKYFPPSSLDYMMIAFTKCEGKACKEIETELLNESNVKSLFEALFTKIKQDRRIATECKDGKINILQQRKKILESICKCAKENGMSNWDVRDAAIKNLQKDIEKKLRMSKVRRYAIRIIVFVVVICIPTLYYKRIVKAETANTSKLVTQTEAIATKLEVGMKNLGNILTKIRENGINALAKSSGTLSDFTSALGNYSSMKNDLHGLTQEIKHQLSSLQNTISTLPKELTEVAKEIQLLQNKVNEIAMETRILYFVCYIITAISMMMFYYIMYTIWGYQIAKNKRSKLFAAMNLRKTSFIYAAIHGLIIAVVAFNHYRHI